MTPYSSSKTVCIVQLFRNLTWLLTTSHLILHLTVKKKFLLANKHITKSVHVTLWYSSRSDRLIRLNSTLSARIEELNAQISVLHVENLRLRASEIALGSQLKKEREKSQRILADAESAVSPRFYVPAWIAIQREAVWLSAFSYLVYFLTFAPHRPRNFFYFVTSYPCANAGHGV